MKLAALAVACGWICFSAPAQKIVKHASERVSIDTAPPRDARPTPFRDSRFGVRFQVPPGWSVNTRDGQVSTFRLDAHSAAAKAQMRSVASLEFNPFPHSVLSGATFYYSVERHAKDKECAAQAAPNMEQTDIQDIGGMEFRHGHDERGQMCVEQRDEVYTAFRKGSCYRFDLAVNTFCAVSSGADELTERQFLDVERQMTSILSTVALDWKKGATHPVPVPPIVHKEKKAAPELIPREPPSAHAGS
jgi:hypothetical protein